MPTFIPSFEDLYRIIQAIAECEDRKYPNGKGRKLLAEFLVHAVHCPSWDILRDEMQIPNRGFASEEKLDIQVLVMPQYGNKEWVRVGLKKWA